MYSKQPKELPEGRVRVYRNLHKKRWSVQHKTSKGWRVWAHTKEIILENAELKVNKAGRERVLRERRKNVHAYVIGDPIFVRGLTLNTPTPKELSYIDTNITYDPYKYSSFVINDNKKEITHAQKVRLVFPSRYTGPVVWVQQ